MPSKFQPKIKKARFVVSPFSASQMIDIGQSAVEDSIKPRIRAGLNANDQPARPLTPRYARFKTNRGGSNVRDWNRTGRTLRGMRVLSASENRVTIGFSDPVALLRARMNNRRERQFGVSPRDRAAIVRTVARARFVKAQAA